MSSALVAIEPGATPLTRTLGAQSAASRRVMCASAALAVPYATYPRSRNRPIADVMLTTDPLPVSSRWGSAAAVSANAVLTLKWNAPSNVFTSVSVNGIGMEPPTLLTTTSSRPNSATAVSTRAVDRVEVGQVGGHARPRAGRAPSPGRRRRRAGRSVRAAMTTSAPALGEGERPRRRRCPVRRR